MATYEVLIPPLLCAFGLLIWNGHSYASGTDHLLLESRNRVRAFPDRTQVKSRLEHMGRGGEYESFRLKQISWASLGAGLVFLVALVLIGKPFAATILSGLGGFGIYLLIDRHLSREVIAYRLEIESEFASIVEMLTLSLSAGETPLNAIARISLRAHGLLASEFGRVIELVREGLSFHASLDALGRRVDSVVIRRFVDSLITAMLRGAPLIEVLQRHAGEARQNQRNILMDKAGKAEISMMVPVVFLILPISVLFALWPSLTHLNLFAA